MRFKKLRSWAKINLSLNVIKRLPNNYHNIESLITFVQSFDEIKIKIIDKAKHKISFSGKFSKGIGKNNTIIELLNLLEKNKLIKNKKFEIKVTKNIPQKSGMGGGSMNAACILKYLMKKKIIENNQKEVINCARQDAPVDPDSYSIWDNGRGKCVTVTRGCVPRPTEPIESRELVFIFDASSSMKETYNPPKVSNDCEHYYTRYQKYCGSKYYPSF